MRGGNRAILFVIGGLVLLVLVLVFFFTAQDRGDRYSWLENFDPESDQPYGTQVLKTMLENRLDGQQLSMSDEPLSKTLSDLETPSNYFYIYNYLFYSSDGDLDSLLAYVERGNRAFICTAENQWDLVYRLGIDDCSTLEVEAGKYAKKIHMNLEHPDHQLDEDLEVYYQNKSKQEQRYWYSLDTTGLCDTADQQYAVLGRFNDSLVNFYRVPYGAGEFYFFRTPIAFSNYHLLREPVFEYAQHVFAHLNEGPIHWDRYSQRFRHSYNDRARFSDKTPLQFILNEDTLRWSLYLAIFLLLAFVLFRSRRQQRIIPVLAENTNTSLQFIETIGRIYFLQNDHKKLAIQKKRLFLTFIRDRYGLQTNKQDDQLIKAIAAKSQVPQKQVKVIFNHFTVVEKNAKVEDFLLINLHKAIDQFYKTCR